MEIPILSILLFVPFIFALAIWIFGGENEDKIRALAKTGTGCALVISLGLLWKFNTADAGIQFEEKSPWISSINVFYHLGIDGLSTALVLLTTAISVLVFAPTYQRKV